MPDYELLRCIGHGSYGDVWIARNVLGQFRAVKMIYRSRFSDPRPFEREFEGIQRFEPISRSHPSQLHILHVGKSEAEGCFYYVMELADDAHAEPGRASLPRRPELPPTSQQMGNKVGGGAPPPYHVEDYVPRTLRHDLQQHGRLPPADCVQIGLSLATALAHLHEQGLVHRDIKPSNVIFVNGVAKLGDIGLVTDAGDTQSIVGTEGYLPPEGPGTPQADLFSLGKVLYEISTGMDRRRFAELPEDLHAWPDRTDVIEFNEVVLKACAKSVKQRYASAEQIRADLDLLQQGKSVKRARSWWRLRSVAGKAASVATILAILLALVLPRLTRQRQDTSADGPPSTNQTADALCSKALRNLRADNQRGFPEVYTNLHRAIQLDPNFAKPYVGLLELRLRESMPGVKYPPEENERTITRRLMELASESAAAHCGQAILSYYDWDFPRAERHARRTIQADPDYELGHTWYGFMLENWGRPVEARQQLEIARMLNPSKVQIYRCLAHAYYVERNFPRAIEMYRETIGWEPHDLVCYRSVASAHQAMGDFQKAIGVLEEMESIKSGEKPQVGGRLDRLRGALEKDGVRGYWEDEWKQTPTNQLYFRAVIQAWLGNTNSAFALLEQSYQTHERSGRVQDYLTSLLFDEVWDPLHQDTRFQQLLDKVGFTKVMPPPKN